MTKTPKLNDVIALLKDAETGKLPRGQVGTVVEILDRDTVLVEFSDDDGKAFAISPIRASDALVLHYEPEAA